MMLVKMAWRNVMRSRRRTAITALSVAFGVLLSVTFTASGDYGYTNMINTGAVMGFGHLTVEPPGYNDSPTLAKRLRRAGELRRAVLGQGGVAAAFDRIMGQAMFASGTKTAGGMFLAIDPARETAEWNIFLQALEEGNLFSRSDGRGVVIGVQMARKLNLHLGKKLVYTVADKDGELVSAVGRVSGIFRTGDDLADGSMVLLPIDRLRAVLGYEKGAASFIALFLEDQRRAERMRPSVAAASAGADVLTWRETQAELAGFIAVDRLFNYLMQLLVGLVIVAGIMNTLLMSVLERRREFGVMLAIGMQPGQLVRLVLFESCWIGFFGLLLGIVLTAPWYGYMHTTGIDFSGLFGEQYSVGGVLVDTVVKFRLFKESAIAILLGLFGLTLVAGLYPAFRAGRMAPVESMKQLG